MSAQPNHAGTHAAPVPRPTRTSRCPEGECNAIINVYPQANPDRDGNYLLCAYCDESVCVSCHRNAVFGPCEMCDDCARGEAWSDFDNDRNNQPNPSDVTHTRWLRLETPDARELKWKNRDDDRRGHWLIFSNSWEQHDANWRLVVGALEGLGGAAAASTSRDARRNGGIVLVTTQDADDVEDVKRVLVALRDLGITGSLRYTPDAEDGVARGSSRYWSPANNGRWMRDLRSTASS